MKKTNWLQRFLWSIAGAEVSILEQNECRTDHKKYSAIGSAILVTTFWAFCSGALAAWFFTQRTVPAPNGQENAPVTSGSLGAALAFGIIWAILIFCIDRCLVITLKKDPTLEKQKWFVPFSIRFVLALIIAFMMSIPLELFVFKDLVEAKMPDYDEFHVANFGKRIEAGIEADSLGKEIKVKQKVLDGLYYTDSIERAHIENEKIQLDSWKRKRNTPSNYDKYVTADNKCKEILEPYRGDTNYYRNGRWVCYPNGYNEACNERASAKKAWEAKCDTEIDELTKRYMEDTAAHNKTAIRILSKEEGLARDESNRAAADEERKEKQLDKEFRLQKTNHFIRNFEILNWAVRPSNDGGWLNFILLNLIRFIFFMIELLPTVVKIWTPVGNYDRMVYAEERELMNYLSSTEYSDRVRNMHDAEMEAKEDQIKQQHDVEMELKKDILEKVKEAQTEVADAAIAKWKEEELLKLKSPVDEAEG